MFNFRATVTTTKGKTYKRLVRAFSEKRGVAMLKRDYGQDAKVEIKPLK